MIKHNPLLLISLAVLLLVYAPSKAAIEFDGVDDYVTSTGATISTTFTISVWVKPNSQASAYGAILYDPYITGNNKGLYYRGSGAGVDSSKLTYWNNGPVSNGNSTTTLTNGVWNHVVVSSNAGSATYYINGTAAGSFTAPACTFKLLGYDNFSTDFFKGSIDDVRIYNRALTVSEIEVLYNAKRKRVGGSVANGMVAHYEMDGGEIGSAVSTVIDASGNSNHGTGNGGASLKFIDGVVQR